MSRVPPLGRLSSWQLVVDGQAAPNGNSLSASCACLRGWRERYVYSGPTDPFGDAIAT